MQKSKLAKYILAAVLAGSMSLLSPQVEAAVQVNPIPGLSSEFIKGADVSMLEALEKNGAKFYENGTAMDCLDILQEHGINWIRLRIWNNPYVYGPEGNGGGVTDEVKALDMAARAKAKGLKVLIDFHYSDWWADPGKQVKPEAWKNDGMDKLPKDVYDYTSRVLQDFNAKGITPDMVQVGNEINAGMIWPEGKLTSPQGYSNVAKMLKAGLQAVKDNDPNHQIRRMIHLANGGDNALYQNFFDQLIKDNGVNDFDIIGLSFYPFWHGTMEQLSYNLNDISARYNKDVIVVETAFGFTNENGDAQKNCYGPNEERLGGYKSSVQGQATGLHDIMQQLANVKNGRGIGMFYWEPDWIPAPNTGWKAGEGNEWDNLAMFDFQGNALDSLDVFHLVSEAGNTAVEPEPRSVDPILLDGSVGKPVSLPKSVDVTYTNDALKGMNVDWDTAAPVYDAPGNYQVSGTVAGTALRVTADVKVARKNNLLQNGDFEAGSLSGWSITGSTSAVNIVGTAGDVRGKTAMHYWLDHPFSFTAVQVVKGLKNGKYTAVCWTQGSGTEASYQLFVSDYGGEKRTADIKDDGWNKWHQWVIRDIEVKNGQAVIGIDMKGNAGNWGSVDDIEFYLQE